MSASPRLLAVLALAAGTALAAAPEPTAFWDVDAVRAGMTGYALRVMSVGMRAGFVLAGLMLLMPFQAATVNGWINASSESTRVPSRSNTTRSGRGAWSIGRGYRPTTRPPGQEARRVPP